MFKKYDAYLVGYYGMLNTGDDALMHASIWGMQEIIGCPKIKVGLYGNYNFKTNTVSTLSLRSEQSFPGQNRLLHYAAAMQSKRIIFGGGSVLHSETDINLKRHLMALSSRKKSMAVGVGLGPFNSIGAEKACAKFLNECGYVGVRDKQSLDVAKAIAPKANVHKTFDLAPLLLSSPEMNLKTTSRQGIALSLCSIAVNAMGDTHQENEKARIEQFAELINTLYAKTSEPITLIELNGHNSLGDWKINSQVLQRIDKHIPISIKNYQENPFTLVNTLSSFKAVLSMRLHGSILSYLAKTPVLSINYHRKCEGWCEDIGMHQDYQINPSNLNINHIVKQIVQGLNSGFKQPKLALDAAVQNSLSNWSSSHE